MNHKDEVLSSRITATGLRRETRHEHTTEYGVEATRLEHKPGEIYLHIGSVREGDADRFGFGSGILLSPPEARHVAALLVALADEADQLVRIDA